MNAENPIQILAESIAMALGPGWAAQPGEHRDVVLLAGPGITLDVRPNRSQVVIAPVLGALWRWAPREADVRIGVDAGRSVSAIAGEITRRLLPKARSLLADCLQGKLKYDEYTAAKWATARRLAEALGQTLPESWRDPDRDACVSFYRDGLSVRAQVSGSDVDLRLSVPADLAVQVCEIVRAAMDLPIPERQP